MQATHFEGVDVVLGAPKDWDATKHGPCVGLPIMRRDGVCISRWVPTWRERLRILFGRAIYAHVASGMTQPPIALTVDQ
jgi:hypothetical protein